jgi:hypothetical protein
MLGGCLTCIKTPAGWYLNSDENDHLTGMILPASSKDWIMITVVYLITALQVSHALLQIFCQQPDPDPS